MKIVIHKCNEDFFFMLEEKKIGYILIKGKMENLPSKPIDEKKHFFDFLFKKKKSLFSLPFSKEEKFLEFFHCLQTHSPHPIHLLDLEKKNLSLLEKIQTEPIDEWVLLPLHFHFSYQCTGAIAKFLYQHLEKSIIKKLFWIRSFSLHPSFLHAYCAMIEKTLIHHQIQQEETIFLFYAEKPLEDYRDIYSYEYESSMKKIIKHFPYAIGEICYHIPQDILPNEKNRKNILLLPFSSFDEEKIFSKNMPKNCYACLFSQMFELWQDPLLEILQTSILSNTFMLMPPLDTYEKTFAPL